MYQSRESEKYVKEEIRQLELSLLDRLTLIQFIDVPALLIVVLVDAQNHYDNKYFVFDGLNIKMVSKRTLLPLEIFFIFYEGRGVIRFYQKTSFFVKKQSFFLTKKNTFFRKK